MDIFDFLALGSRGEETGRFIGNCGIHIHVMNMNYDKR